MGVVDALVGLDLIVGRARAVGAEFILAGPLNLWFRGLSPPPRKPSYILVTSADYTSILVSALSIGAKEIPWPEWWNNVEGRSFNAYLRDYHVTVLTDPIIKNDISESRFYARDLARNSMHIVLGNNIVRLAPLYFEYTLKQVIGGAWKMEE